VLGIFQQSEAADDRVALLECSRAAQDHGTLSGTVSDISGTGISGALISASFGPFRQAVTTDLIAVIPAEGASRCSRERRIAAARSGAMSQRRHLINAGRSLPIENVNQLPRVPNQIYLQFPLL
jgi:hypothetical protein